MGKTMQLIFSVSQPSYQLGEGYKKPTYLSLVVPAQNGKNNSFKAPDILVRKDSVSPDNLVMRIAGYSAFDFSKNAAVKKGNRNRRGMQTSIYNSSSKTSSELHAPAIWIRDRPLPSIFRS